MMRPLSAVVTFAAIALSSMPLLPVWAQSTAPFGELNFIPPHPPDLGRPPGNLRGGGTRGNCPDVTTELTALAPTLEALSQDSSPTVWGLTTDAHPTFWFYVPYDLTLDRPGEFVLLDDQNNYVYQTSVITPAQTAGVISVALPDSTPELEAGKMYSWVFLIYCEADNPLFTRGGIQRAPLSSDLAAQLEQATPEAQVRLYAQNGVWYDALTQLATLRQENPNDAAIATDWQNLLHSVGLDDIADMPLVEQTY